MSHDFALGFRGSGLSLNPLRLDDGRLSLVYKLGTGLRSGIISSWVLIAGFVLLLPETATAHGFGQRYDLPIPLPFWVFGAGATILLSFVLVAAIARGAEGSFLYPRVNLFRWPVFQMLSHPAVLFAIRAGGVIALGAGVTAGFWG